ncbi:hypothetical protein [Komagataeibacter melaceti]|uniref:hypothetical protein n=1 Tax=Komagataeibacter melaceti TaxID=2766577 RepID=UPI0011E5FD1D|nr:hypothetical protein [Komagataeibacter melaceti]
MHDYSPLPRRTCGCVGCGGGVVSGGACLFLHKCAGQGVAGGPVMTVASAMPASGVDGVGK